MTLLGYRSVIQLKNQLAIINVNQIRPHSPGTWPHTSSPSLPRDCNHSNQVLCFSLVWPRGNQNNNKKINEKKKEKEERLLLWQPSDSSWVRALALFDVRTGSFFLESGLLQCCLLLPFGHQVLTTPHCSSLIFWTVVLQTTSAQWTPLLHPLKDSGPCWLQKFVESPYLVCWHPLCAASFLVFPRLLPPIQREQQLWKHSSVSFALVRASSSSGVCIFPFGNLGSAPRFSFHSLTRLCKTPSDHICKKNRKNV